MKKVKVLLEVQYDGHSVKRNTSIVYRNSCIIGNSIEFPVNELLDGVAVVYNPNIR